MFKRLFWLCVGVGLGVGLSIQVTRVARRTAERYTPESVAGRLADAARSFAAEVKSALAEGRDAMRERERELWVEMEGRAERRPAWEN